MEDQVNTDKDVSTNSSIFYKLKGIITQRNIMIGIVIFFIIWITFFDRNNLIARIHMMNEHTKNEESVNTYKQKIAKTKEEDKALDDDKYIEKFARENLMMKKDNEDIYIVSEK